MKLPPPRDDRPRCRRLGQKGSQHANIRPRPKPTYRMKIAAGHQYRQRKLESAIFFDAVVHSVCHNRAKLPDSTASDLPPRYAGTVGRTGRSNMQSAKASFVADPQHVERFTTSAPGSETTIRPKITTGRQSRGDQPSLADDPPTAPAAAVGRPGCSGCVRVETKSGAPVSAVDPGSQSSPGTVSSSGIVSARFDAASEGTQRRHRQHHAAWVACHPPEHAAPSSRAGRLTRFKRRHEPACRRNDRIAPNMNGVSAGARGADPGIDPRLPVPVPPVRCRGQLAPPAKFRATALAMRHWPGCQRPGYVPPCQRLTVSADSCRAVTGPRHSCARPARRRGSCARQRYPIRFVVVRVSAFVGGITTRSQNQLYNTPRPPPSATTEL